MTGLPTLFDADDTREKYFSGATWTARVPNSGIRDGATRYMGPRKIKRASVRTDFLTDVAQQSMDTILADLLAQVAEERAILEYISEHEEVDYEHSMRRALLPGWLFSSVDMNSSIVDWCSDYRFKDSRIRTKFIGDRRQGLALSLEEVIKTWYEDAPALTPDSFYELETAVISLHPSD